TPVRARLSSIARRRKCRAIWRARRKLAKSAFNSVKFIVVLRLACLLHALGRRVQARGGGRGSGMDVVRSSGPGAQTNASGGRAPSARRGRQASFGPAAGKAVGASGSGEGESRGRGAAAGCRFPRSARQRQGRACALSCRGSAGLLDRPTTVARTSAHVGVSAVDELARFYAGG